MAQIARERRERYPNVSVHKTLPDIRTYDTLVFWGNYSYSVPRDGARLLADSAVVDIGNGWQTQTEVARDYLKAKYPNARLRANGRQANLFRTRPPMPLYSKPGVIHDASYLDLRSAFWSIMQLVGWDVDYNPAKWLSPGTAPTDFPLPNNKVSRNSLVTSGLPTPSYVWTGTRFSRRSGGKRAVNLGLWFAISDVLHLCARYALDCGARWIHTDGYIIDSAKAEYLRTRIEGLGLECTIKATGLCVILGQGRYMVGNRMTALMSGELAGRVNNLRDIPAAWLEGQLEFCRKRRDKLQAIRNTTL